MTDAQVEFVDLTARKESNDNENHDNTIERHRKESNTQRRRVCDWLQGSASRLLGLQVLSDKVWTSPCATKSAMCVKKNGFISFSVHYPDARNYQTPNYNWRPGDLSCLMHNVLVCTAGKNRKTNAFLSTTRQVHLSIHIRSFLSSNGRMVPTSLCAGMSRTVVFVSLLHRYNLLVNA